MSETLFISDLHLDRDRPERVQLFIEFLNHRAQGADALYILGDLFEYWLGDDDRVAALQAAIDALRDYAQSTATYFIHGNRDFLIGDDFSQYTHITILPDETLIDLYGRPTLLLHGDSLCTDDVDYQQAKKMLRSPTWQSNFLNQSLDERHAIAEDLRAKSRAAQKNKTDDIMDVNEQSVIHTFQKHNVFNMIHGHTHRPAVHEYSIDNKTATRTVLSDWHDRAKYFSVTA